MDIRSEDLSKRFLHQWVFRKLSFEIPSGTQFAIAGPNGSGKSTLLRILAGVLTPTSGSLTYLTRDGDPISSDALYRQVAFAAPYAELIEELTLAEAFRLHSRFRPFDHHIGSLDDFLAVLDFNFHRDKQIATMSSGMKQRLRLAFATCSDAGLLLLDEPTSNLDTGGILWFHQLLGRFAQSKTICIASNVEDDLRSCTQRIRMTGAA